MANPGFPVEGGANPPGLRQPTILPKFVKKLHEIVKILGRRGGTRRERPPLNPPLIVMGNKQFRLKPGKINNFNEVNLPQLHTNFRQCISKRLRLLPNLIMKSLCN